MKRLKELTLPVGGAHGRKAHRRSVVVFLSIF